MPLSSIAATLRRIFKPEPQDRQCIQTVDNASPGPACFSTPYVILDVETTGLDPEEDQIIQLSALRFTQEGQPDGTFNTYLNPGRRIPPRASQINGITNRMVANAPTAEELKAEFAAFCDGCLVVGYNVLFDLKFLYQAFGDAFRQRNYLDVLPLARNHLYAPNYKLETISISIGFQPKGGFHDSLGDCEATAAVLARLSSELGLMDAWMCRFYGGPTEAEKKKRAEWDQWLTYSQPLYQKGEDARKAGRLGEALRFYDQAKEASGVVYPFLFESYAMAYRKQRDFQNEIRILDEGIARLGENNCPTLVERRGKAVQKLEAAEAAELEAEKKARKCAERAERKQRELEEAATRPKRQQNRPVLKLDDAGTILEEFPSVSAAAHAAGITTKGIRDAVTGRQQHAGGFRWKYKYAETDGSETSEVKS